MTSISCIFIYGVLRAALTNIYYRFVICFCACNVLARICNVIMDLDTV